MIGRLRGTLASSFSEQLLMDVNGVGYVVAVTPSTLAELPPIGEEVVLHTHTHVREDQLSLYGFLEAGDRNTFQILLGASGVGPKLALAILATLDDVRLREAVNAQDTAALEMVPGVGKRTAQKLILELRPKLDLPTGDIPGDVSDHSEVRDALESLGFAPNEVREVMIDLTEGDTETMLKDALQRLGQT